MIFFCSRTDAGHIFDRRGSRSSRPFYDSGGNGGEFDEIEVTGESTRSHLQSSSSRLPHQSGSSAAARARTDWGGKPHAIAVPNNGRYGGASAHKGYSTQSDSYTMQPQRPAPLRGTKGQSAFVSISTANLKAAEAAEIRAADLARVQEETRKQELARHKTEKTQKARLHLLTKVSTVSNIGLRASFYSLRPRRAPS